MDLKGQSIMKQFPSFPQEKPGRTVDMQTRYCRAFLRNKFLVNGDKCIVKFRFCDGQPRLSIYDEEKTQKKEAEHRDFMWKEFRHIPQPAYEKKRLQFTQQLDAEALHLNVLDLVYNKLMSDKSLIVGFAVQNLIDQKGHFKFVIHPKEEEQLVKWLKMLTNSAPEYMDLETYIKFPTPEGKEQFFASQNKTTQVTRVCDNRQLIAKKFDYFYQEKNEKGEVERHMCPRLKNEIFVYGSVDRTSIPGLTKLLIEPKTNRVLLLNIKEDNTLESLMEKRITLTLNQKKHIVLSILKAIVALNNREVGHGAITPAHILIDAEFDPYLISFSSAKSNKYRKGQMDIDKDVFDLGIIFYELLTEQKLLEQSEIGTLRIHEKKWNIKGLSEEEQRLLVFIRTRMVETFGQRADILIKDKCLSSKNMIPLELYSEKLKKPQELIVRWHQMKKNEWSSLKKNLLAKWQHSQIEKEFPKLPIESQLSKIFGTPSKSPTKKKVEMDKDLDDTNQSEPTLKRDFIRDLAFRRLVDPLPTKQHKQRALQMVYQPTYKPSRLGLGLLNDTQFQAMRVVERIKQRSKKWKQELQTLEAENPISQLKVEIMSEDAKKPIIKA